MATHADDPDPVIGVEVASDRALRQIGLRTHEAMRRITEFRWYAHHRVRVVARAVLGIGCNCSRANEYQCGQHSQSPNAFPDHSAPKARAVTLVAQTVVANVISVLRMLFLWFAVGPDGNSVMVADAGHRAVTGS